MVLNACHLSCLLSKLSLGDTESSEFNPTPLASLIDTSYVQAVKPRDYCPYRSVDFGLFQEELHFFLIVVHTTKHFMHPQIIKYC